MGRPRRRLASGALGVGAALALSVAGSATAGFAAPETWAVAALPVAASGASSFSEPGVVPGRDGTLLADACTANSGSPATLWRSRDFGRAWSFGETVAPSSIGCGDTDAAIGTDGYQYTLVLGAGIDVYRSKTGGRWEGPATFPPPHGEDQPDRPWLVTSTLDPNVVYLFNSEIGGNIVEWVSHDHAQSFQGPVPVTAGINSQAALALGSRPLVDPAHPSRMYEYYETASLAGVTASGSPSGPAQFPLAQLWEASSIDAGLHWSNRLVLDVPTAFAGSDGTLGHLLPATAVDAAGRRFVVLSVQLGNRATTHLYLIRSTKTGWTAPSPIGETTTSNVMPAIAVGDAGALIASWYASTAPDFTGPDARWTEMAATTTNPLATHPHFQFRRLSGARPVHVGGVDNMGAVGNDLGQNWALRDFQSITVDSCGRPHVVWADDGGPTPRAYVASLTGICQRRVPAAAAPRMAASEGSAPDRLPTTGGITRSAAAGVIALALAGVLEAAARRRSRPMHT